MKVENLDEKVKSYLIEVLKNQFDIKDTKEAINECKRKFNSEYSWRAAQVGEQKAIIDWLQGLAINIEFYNHSILDLAIKWGSIPGDYTEKQADKILENYWILLSAKLGQLFRGYRIPKEGD